MSYGGIGCNRAGPTGPSLAMITPFATLRIITTGRGRRVAAGRNLRGLAFSGAMLGVLAGGGAHALPVRSIVIDTPGGPQRFHVEIAADKASQARGLMHRKRLARDAGMLFDFHRAVMTSFWMKDTPLPLDMIFVKPDGTISMVAADAVPNSTSDITSVEPIRAVIEINGGLSQTLGIHPGEVVHATIFGNSGGKSGGHSGAAHARE